MIKLSERAIRNALKKINEVHDPWAEAEYNYRREKLPQGWEKIDREDDEPLYRDPDGNEYVKDEYGKFTPIEQPAMDLEEEEKNGINYGEDFKNWAFSECDKNNYEVSGAIYNYIYNDDDNALFNVIQMYKDANGIEVEDDSQDDIWMSEEIRRAIDDMAKSGAVDQQESLCEAYGIGYNGQFISEKPGWGPRLTSFPQDAKKFNSPREAQMYIAQNLPDFGASVVSLPLADDDDELYESTIIKEDIGIEPDKYYRVEDGTSFPLGLVLRGDQIGMFYHQGSCDDDVAAGLQMPEIAKQLNAIDDESLDRWWNDCYVDDTPEEHANADRETKLSWLLFNACANAIDNDEYELVDSDNAAKDTAMLKEAIKSIIRESFANRAMFQQPMMAQGDMQEKGTWKSKHNQSNQHFKTNPKTARDKRQSKRAIVIRWLRDPSVNCAEIMRLLWHPAPEDEDTKRGEFYKKRDGAINKDSGARYSFTDDEINSLYKIKSGRV